MTFGVGALNILLGVAYTTYGFITIHEMWRGWKTMGFSHFGAAWILMAFTCGPHHLTHGVHVLLEGRTGGPLDLFAVAIGLPAGVAFLSLRLEAAAGGRGDRFITGTPFWIQAIPTLSAVYLTVLGYAAVSVALTSPVPRFVVPNLFLVVLYFMIGYFLLRTQLRNKDVMHGWSVSGLSLSIVFPTCALMHGVYAMYAANGLYFDVDWHGWVIDVVGVPAAMYFLWVVRGLYKRALQDWNRQMVDAVPDRTAAVVASAW